MTGPANILLPWLGRLAGAFALTGFAAGCAHQPPPTTRPSLATTQPGFWLDEPAAATVHARDFQRLWDACEETAREYGFTLDRQDYRNGVITTAPMVSKQWFEIWRNDARTLEDGAKSSLATYRRTLRFNLTREADNTFTAAPKVLIERYVQAERPIMSSAYLRRAFRTTPNYHPVGSPEADVGIYLPQRYWYPTGRDAVIEEDIAKRVRGKLP